jgi:integrase
LSTAQDTLTVDGLAEAYLRFARSYYVKHGRPTREAEGIEYATRPLRHLYGPTPARDFGPRALKAVRQKMIESGLCRNEVNKWVAKIVRAFKWAVEEELVPPSIHHGLKAVAGLRRGRSPARESEPVKPVPDAHVDATLPRLSAQIRAMVELQRLTGMRPGEGCIMRTGDLDRSGTIWVYRPSEHKTEHHGKDRRIFLGPQAQAVVRPWLRANPSEYLFQPKEVRWAQDAERSKHRATPMTPSQRERHTRRWLRPGKKPGDHYTKDSYRSAIRVACKKAGVPSWHPNQLRHSAATRLRKEFGLDVARVILGHSSASTTEIYAEADTEKALDVMGRVG